MIMLSEDELIKRLCWEDRLLNNNAKVRYDANIDLKLLCDSVTDPKDGRLREFGNLFKETVSEPNVSVQDKALDALIAYLKAADADVAGGYAREICDAVVADCLMDRPETVSKAQIVFMLWVELEAVDAVLDAMEKAIKTHAAKAVLPAVDVMFQAISEFGSKIVPPNRLLKMLLEVYDHQDQKVRASSKRLTLELCRWIGRDSVKSILFEKMSDTIVKRELDAELANVTVAAKPTRKIRSEQVKEPELKVATDATRSGPSEESAAKTRLGKDKYELVDPVDILTSLERSGFWNKVKSRQWIQKKEAVAKLTKLASTKRIAPGDCTELCRALKKLITDRSISVRVEAVRAIGNLALELRESFSICSHNLLPVLLAKLREKKPIMTEALTNTLQAIHKAGCVTLASILTDVEAAVKSEDPHVCSRTLNWVMYCIDSSNKLAILTMHKEYVRICLEFLNDGTAQVRDAAFLVLVAIAKSVGTVLLNIPLEKLDDVRRKKLSEMIGVSGGGAPTVARHGIRKQGVSRWRIAEANMARCMKADGPRQKKLVKHKDVEPSEMTLKENESRLESLFQEHSITQLKDAEPLKETNQLQKMSLSDSQEQNKKQKQHTGSESVSQEQNKKRKYHAGSKHGFRHFVKSVWGEDVVTDEEDLETWKEELERMKSLECTKCGLILDMSCVCQREREFGMDEIRSSHIIDYGPPDPYEILETGTDPDPDPWCPPWD